MAQTQKQASHHIRTPPAEIPQCTSASDKLTQCLIQRAGIIGAGCLMPGHRVLKPISASLDVTSKLHEYPRPEMTEIRGGLKAVAKKPHPGPG